MHINRVQFFMKFELNKTMFDSDSFFPNYVMHVDYNIIDTNSMNLSNLAQIKRCLILNSELNSADHLITTMNADHHLARQKTSSPKFNVEPH